MDYTGLNIHEALDLPCDMYLLAIKHATIDKLSQTEEGRKYLADCERLQTTSPDLEAIAKRFGT